MSNILDDLANLDDGEPKTKALRKLFRDRGLSYRAAEHANVVRFGCIRCNLGVPHVIEYMHLPAGWLYESRVAAQLYKLDSDLSEKTAQMRIEREYLTKQRRYAKDYREVQLIDENIAYLDQSMQPIEAKQRRLQALREDMLNEVMYYELFVNGLAGEDMITVYKPVVNEPCKPLVFNHDALLSCLRYAKQAKDAVKPAIDDETKFELQCVKCGHKWQSKKQTVVRCVNKACKTRRWAKQ